MPPKNKAAVPRTDMVDRIGVLRFEDRNRYGAFGIPTMLLFGGGVKCYTNCKNPTKHNQWAKISVSAALIASIPPEQGGAAAGGAAGDASADIIVMESEDHRAELVRHKRRSLGSAE